MERVTIEKARKLVDVAIICVHSDEKTSLLERFLPTKMAFGQREYLIGSVERSDGAQVAVAIVVSGEGPIKSKGTMDDITKDLAPSLTLLVGIAGGIPQQDGSVILGDVAISTGGLDVSAGELNPQKAYRSKPVAFSIPQWAARLANADVADDSWAGPEEVGVSRPPLQDLAKYSGCSDDWFTLIETNFARREEHSPRLIRGTFSSGPSFLRDDGRVKDWQKVVRAAKLPLLVAHEMELVGVHEGSTGRVNHNYLAIKGISDMVGLERDKTWTRYAAAAAASYALSFIRSMPFETKAQRSPGLANDLREFCQWQAEEHMRPLLGSRAEQSKKFIPEVFHEPEALAKTFERFLQGESPTFVVTGRSGDGKSCWMCQKTLELSGSWNSFFYRGQDVQAGIVHILAQEARARLSLDITDQQFIDRVSTLQRPTVVFVDGLDEIAPALAIKLTSEFLHQAASANFRLVVSCKSTRWDQIAQLDDIPTTFWDLARTSESYYHMPAKWQDSDFQPLVKKYRDFYGCAAQFGKRARSEAMRSPYLLRLLFEAGKGLGKSDMISLDQKSLFDLMIARARTRVGAAVPNFESVLCAVAKTMVELDLDSLEESMVIQKVLGLSILDQLPPELFDYSILEREFFTDTPPQVRFYFGRLRDFLVGFRALQWPKLSPAEFQLVAKKAENSSVTRDALELYYSLASEEHQRALDDDIRTYGLNYLHQFRTMVEVEFPQLKSRIVRAWDSNAKLGFVGEIFLSPPGLRTEGVQVRSDGDPEVLLTPSNSDPRQVSRTTMSYLGGYTGNLEKAENAAVAGVWARVKDLVTKRNLDESSCPLLLQERVLAFHAPRYQSIELQLPKSVQESRWKILFDRARRYRQRLFYSLKEERGDCEVRWDGSNQTVMFTPPTDAEQEEIHRFAIESADNKRDVFDERLALQSSEETRILDYLTVLEDMGLSSLTDNPLLAWYHGGATDHTACATRALVGWLAKHVVPTYTELTKHNFPAIWDELPVVARPVRVVMVLEQTQDKEGLNYWKYDSTTTSIELVEEPPSLPKPPDWPPGMRGWGSQAGILPHSCRIGRRQSMGDGLNEHFCMLHTLVYDQIMDGLTEYRPELKRGLIKPQSQAWI